MAIKCGRQNQYYSWCICFAFVPELKQFPPSLSLSLSYKLHVFTSTLRSKDLLQNSCRELSTHYAGVFSYFTHIRLEYPHHYTYSDKWINCFPLACWGKIQSSRVSELKMSSSDLLNNRSLVILLSRLNHIYSIDPFHNNRITSQEKDMKVHLEITLKYKSCQSVGVQLSYEQI